MKKISPFLYKSILKSGVFDPCSHSLLNSTHSSSTVVSIKNALDRREEMPLAQESEWNKNLPRSAWEVMKRNIQKLGGGGGENVPGLQQAAWFMYARSLARLLQSARTLTCGSVDWGGC